MKYLIVRDYSYERNCGADIEDSIVDTAESWEEAEQIIDAIENAARECYIISEKDFENLSGLYRSR